eukprot:scaffold32209_cov48-Phaeocystis_antarctica.AAC.1
MEWVTLEAARSSIRGSGWAPSGPGLFLGVPIYPVPPDAPRGGTGGELGYGRRHFDHAGLPEARASAAGSGQPRWPLMKPTRSLRERAWGSRTTVTAPHVHLVRVRVRVRVTAPHVHCPGTQGRQDGHTWLGLGRE